MADLNRIKVVLAEKKKTGNGLQQNWERTLAPYQSGAVILHNQICTP